ncbi:MAG TPA: tetratricopeptide repeat protein, partial [Polyangia bacterium]
MLRALAIFFGLVALFVVTGELCLRSRESAELRRIETAAEHELLGGGLDGLLHARALALGGAAHARDAEVAATLGLADAMLASEYGLNQADAALASARGTDAPGVSRRAGALKLATRALAEVTSGHLDRAEALALESVALGHKLASPLFALGRIRFRQGNLPAASRAFQAALVREPSLVEARVAWAEVWLEEGARDRAREALVAVLRHTPGHSRAQLLLAELDLASSDAPGEATAWQTACARDEKNSPFLAGACDLARAQRAARSHDGDGAIRFAAAAGRRRPAEPRVLAGAAQVLASLGAVDRAADCLAEARRIASPLLPSLRWARLAIELGR